MSRDVFPQPPSPTITILRESVWVPLPATVPFCVMSFHGPHRPGQFLQQVPKCTEVSGTFIGGYNVRLTLCQVSMLLSGLNFLLLLPFFFSNHVTVFSERVTVIEAVKHVWLFPVPVCTITRQGTYRHSLQPVSRVYFLTTFDLRQSFENLLTFSRLHGWSGTDGMLRIILQKT